MRSGVFSDSSHSHITLVPCLTQLLGSGGGEVVLVVQYKLTKITKSSRSSHKYFCPAYVEEVKNEM